MIPKHSSKFTFTRCLPIFLIGIWLIFSAIPIISQEQPDHGWQQPLTLPSQTADRQFSLAVDSRHRAHLVYLDQDEGARLLYTWWDGAAWQPPQLVADQPGSALSLSLALDGADTPQLAFSTGTAVFYTTKDGPSWRDTAVAVETGPNPGQVSLALDPAGGIHIAYQLDRSLRYATGDGAAWNVETVQADLSAFFFHDLALDAAGQPHLIYNDQGTLFYATRAGSEDFTAQEIFSSEDTLTGEYNALALDSNGTPHVSFQHDETLLVASLVAGEWPVTVADDRAGSGYFSQLVLLGGEQPAVAHYDITAGRLLFTRLQPSGWETETVDEAADVGESAVMIRDGLDRPQIAYYDNDASQIKTIVWNFPPQVSGEQFRIAVDRPLSGNLLANDSDPDGLPLRVVPEMLVGPEPGRGTVQLFADGAFQYLQPRSGYTGPVQFSYQVCDNGSNGQANDTNGLCDTAVVQITIFIPTLLFIDETTQWIPAGEGSKIQLELTDGQGETWAGIQFYNPARDRWETVKGGDGSEAWHGTADRMDQRPWIQTWWLGSEWLGRGPFRWAIYSGPGGYARVYSEPFFLPAQTNRELKLIGRTR